MKKQELPQRGRTTFNPQEKKEEAQVGTEFLIMAELGGV